MLLGKIMHLEHFRVIKVFNKINQFKVVFPSGYEPTCIFHLQNIHLKMSPALKVFCKYAYTFGLYIAKDKKI